MTDWRVHTITEIDNKFYEKDPVKYCYVTWMWVDTDRKIEWKNEKTSYLICGNSYPFNTWKVGDWVEINFDRTRLIERRSWIGRSWRDYALEAVRDTNIIKKFELPTGASYEMQKRVVEAQRNGTNEGEFIAAQGSVQNGNFSYERFAFNKYAGNFFYEKR